jgi:hypothetical protein
MELHPIGAHAAQLGHRERLALSEDLMNGKDIRIYLKNCVCYDTVAFVRFLRGARISQEHLAELEGHEWEPMFNFTMGRPWDGRSPIPRGTAVGFFRLNDRKVFHAAVAVGGARVRSLNGGLFGLTWIEAADLSKVLPHITNGAFAHEGTRIKVYLSSV